MGPGRPIVARVFFRKSLCWSFFFRKRLSAGSSFSSTTTLTADAEKTVIATFRQLTVDEVVDVLFGGPPDLDPDDLPNLEVEEVVDALFR